MHTPALMFRYFAVFWHTPGDAYAADARHAYAIITRAMQRWCAQDAPMLMIFVADTTMLRHTPFHSFDACHADYFHAAAITPRLFDTDFASCFFRLMPFRCRYEIRFAADKFAADMSPLVLRFFFSDMLPPLPASAFHVTIFRLLTLSAFALSLLTLSLRLFRHADAALTMN